MVNLIKTTKLEHVLIVSHVELAVEENVFFQFIYLQLKHIQFNDPVSVLDRA